MWKLTIFWILLTSNATDMYLILDDSLLNFRQKCKLYESISLDENAFYCILSLSYGQFFDGFPFVLECSVQGPFFDTKGRIFPLLHWSKREWESRKLIDLVSFQKKIRVSQWGLSTFEVLQVTPSAYITQFPVEWFPLTRILAYVCISGGISH